jgi:oligopeptide transport system substrate-binding protein
MPPITLTYSGWGGQISALVSSIIYEWRQNLGIDVKVRQLDPQRFSYHLKEEKDQLYSYSWTADYPHPQNFLEVLFRSGNSRNYGEYSNKEIDALLEKAAREQNNVQSLAIYQEVEQKLVNDAATLPLRFRQNYTLVKPYVKGYELDASGVVKFNKVSVEPH